MPDAITVRNLFCRLIEAARENGARPSFRDRMRVQMDAMQEIARVYRMDLTPERVAEWGAEFAAAWMAVPGEHRVCRDSRTIQRQRAVMAMRKEKA